MIGPLEWYSWINHFVQKGLQKVVHLPPKCYRLQAGLFGGEGSRASFGHMLKMRPYWALKFCLVLWSPKYICHCIMYIWYKISGKILGPNINRWEFNTKGPKNNGKRCTNLYSLWVIFCVIRIVFFILISLKNTNLALTFSFLHRFQESKPKLCSLMKKIWWLNFIMRA